MKKTNEIVVDEDAARATGIRLYPGYSTPFTRHEADGAWPNGARVIKKYSDLGGDRTPNGTRGTVLGSLYAPQLGYAYFVEWDNNPRAAIVCVEIKMERIAE